LRGVNCLLEKSTADLNGTCRARAPFCRLVRTIHHTPYLLMERAWTTHAWATKAASDYDVALSFPLEASEGGMRQGLSALLKQRRALSICFVACLLGKPPHTSRTRAGAVLFPNLRPDASGAGNLPAKTTPMAGARLAFGAAGSVIAPHCLRQLGRLRIRRCLPDVVNGGHRDARLAAARCIRPHASRGALRSHRSRAFEPHAAVRCRRLLRNAAIRL